MTNGWSYGVELEVPDVDVRARLPEGWVWSNSDYTVVNSSGIANDPKRQLVLQGGELNSPPCFSVDALVTAVEGVFTWLQPGWNYRSNLHIHIRVPDLWNTLPRLRRVAEFTRRYLPRYWDDVDPLAGLIRGLAGPELTAAMARLRHSERSRHFFIPESRHRLRMAATSCSELLAAEVPHSGKRPLWHLMPREAVNLRSLRKHNTVEFRCFAAPRYAHDVRAAASFARDWLGAALRQGDPEAVVREWSPYLPRQGVFDNRLETGWQRTNFKHNPRSVVAERLKAMGYA